MLYLNITTEFNGVILLTDLTLTSVVFEWFSAVWPWTLWRYLTLTSVVFEFTDYIKRLYPLMYLTLTSVVFECLTIYWQD